MVNMTAASAGLEQVRSLLNTWQVPNDTRTATDLLPDLAGDPQRWGDALPDVPRPAGPDEVAGLAVLRGHLRAALGQDRPAALQPLVDGGWRVRLGQTADEPALTLVPERTTSATAILATVLALVSEGRWYRLRACPDCGWVFYDSSRNARRTWCSMTAAEGTRGCGSIAKTRAYRTRQRVGGPPTTNSV